MINLNWPDFYDPDFYESEIGPGLRVGTAYADLLSDQVYHSVAELGCGPGAIVIELAKRGLHVKGIDRSPAMLERARLRASSLEPSVRDRIQFIEGLLEDFSLEEPVDAVLMTNELVLHLTETESLVGAFNCSRLSLVPGGRLMLDLPKIDWQALAAAIGKGGDAVNCRGFFLSPSKDFTIRVVEQLRFDPEKCHVSKMFCYEQIDKEGRLIGKTYRHLVQRPWTVDEIRFALTIAGFERVGILNIPSFTDRTFIVASALER